MKGEKGRKSLIEFKGKKVVGFLKVQGLYSSKILGFKDSQGNPLLTLSE